MTHKPEAYILSLLEACDKGQVIDGVQTAGLLKCLAECECAVGGPYVHAPGAKPDRGFNLAIHALLDTLGVTLPNLTTFLKAQRPQENGSSVYAQKVVDQLAARFARGHAVTPPSSAYTPSTGELRMMTRIRRHAQDRFASLSPELRSAAFEIMERTIAGNPDHQMSLMTYYMRAALGKKALHITNDEIAAHALANIFFWSAFIVYDDFWDEDEAAEPRHIPVANLFARHYTDYFSTLLPPRAQFRTFVHTVMDALDVANEWEMLHCRMHIEEEVLTIPSALPPYGDYTIKFYPAAGHVLGPVGILVQLGYPIDGEEVAHFVSYCEHYLIGMQLNDDLHDWKEDLLRGHISTVVSALLARWKEKYPDRNTIHLVYDMPTLEQLFWFEVFSPLTDMVLDRSQRARSALAQMKSIENPAPLLRFVENNEHTAREAQRAKAKSDAFLREFA